MPPGNDIACGWEAVETVIAEPNFRHLIEQQWRELTHLPERPPQPDFALMLKLEAAGAYRLWIARADGELVGFIQWQLCSTLGYRGEMWAFDCGWYINREKVGGGAAIRLWRSALGAIGEMGITVVRGHDNVKQPLPGFFKRLGLSPVSTVYQKVL